MDITSRVLVRSDLFKLTLILFSLNSKPLVTDGNNILCLDKNNSYGAVLFFTSSAFIFLSICVEQADKLLNTGNVNTMHCFTCFVLRKQAMARVWILSP